MLRLVRQVSRALRESLPYRYRRKKRGYRGDPEVDALAQARESLRTGDYIQRLKAWQEVVGDPHVAADASPLWVASSLPPDRSGVAFYTQRTFATPMAPVALFAAVDSPQLTEAARKDLDTVRRSLDHAGTSVDLLSISTLVDARRAIPTQPVLFVLGNSHHHLHTFDFLLNGGAKPGDAVHLHDVFLRGLLALYVETYSALRKTLLKAYPEDVVKKWVNSQEGGYGGTNPPLGPRVLVRRAGIRHFVVNSNAAADRLRGDLGAEADQVRIDALFLPVIARPNVSRQSEACSVLRIGHFGIIHAAKQTDRLIAACDLLAGTRTIELVFAGYDVRSHLRENGLEREYVRVIESASDDELEEIMSGVDCAVQLRYPDHGESSGVVNQLLALRRPVICTMTGSFTEMAAAVHLVPPDVTPADLAGAIEQAANAGWPAAAEELVNRRSPAVFEARVRGLLGLDAVS